MPPENPSASTLLITCYNFNRNVRMVIVVEMDNLMLGWIKNNSGRSGIAARHERNLWKIRARCFMMVHRWV
ncbi:hypothetical protein V6N13_094110 [Hibiscus sabdariffa]